MKDAKHIEVLKAIRAAWEEIGGSFGRPLDKQISRGMYPLNDRVKSTSGYELALYDGVPNNLNTPDGQYLLGVSTIPNYSNRFVEKLADAFDIEEFESKHWSDGPVLRISLKDALRKDAGDHTGAGRG